MKLSKRTEKTILIQSKLISKEWGERTKQALITIKKMKKRQQSLSFEEAYNEAMKQAERIRNKRQSSV